MIKRDVRGISPVVATILLVAIVIVVALIVFLWFRGIVGDYGEKFGKNIELVCDDVVFDASYSGGNLFITNDGNVPIFKMDLVLTKPGSHTTVSLDSLEYSNWKSTGLSQGDVYSESPEIPDFDELTDITLVPVLVGTADDGSRKSFTCGENQGLQLILS